LFAAWAALNIVFFSNDLAREVLMRGSLMMALLLAQLATPAFAQEAKLPPVDEPSGDAAWVRFRTALLAALEQRDKNFVLSVLDPRISNGEDTPTGVAEFKKQWDFDKDPKEFWVELRRVLSLGSVYVRGRTGTQICGPYVAMKWPAGHDPARSGAIISNEALVKERPAAQSRTLATLSYDIVAVADWEVADEDKGSPQKWVMVTLKARAGYVPEEHIRSAIEHRACFRRTSDGWKMTALYPGL
jgi:hypothetical protein